MCVVEIVFVTLPPSLSLPLGVEACREAYWYVFWSRRVEVLGASGRRAILSEQTLSTLLHVNISIQSNATTLQLRAGKYLPCRAAAGLWETDLGLHLWDPLLGPCWITCVYEDARHAWDFWNLPCLTRLNNPIESSNISKPLLGVGTAALVFSRYNKGNPVQVTFTVWWSSTVLRKISW